jgi:hypothetical protein
MDIGKSFTFVFEDEEWITKILIAAAILLVGTIFSWVLAIPLILASALLGGYGMEITRRVIRGDFNKLPEWDDWGTLLIDGIKVAVIGIVYALPLIVVALCFTPVLAVLSDSAEALGTLVGVFLGCIVFLYTIVLSIIAPAAIAFYAAADDLSAAFRFGEILTFVRNNLSTYLITFIMTWVAGLIGDLGSLVCGVGWLATVPYATLVTFHLYGQAYVQASGQAAAPSIEVDVEEFQVDDEETA